MNLLICLAAEMKRPNRCNRRCWAPALASVVVLALRFVFHRAASSLQPRTVASHETPQSNLLHHPFYGVHDLCGDSAWLRAYADVHAAARRSRVLVSVGVEAGLGDRLLGVMSEFFWAVLSGRALLLTTYSDGSLPRWQDAVDPVMFDWRAEEAEFPSSLTLPLHYTYQGERGFGGNRGYGPDVDPARDAQYYMVNRGREAFLQENLTTFAGRRGAQGRERLFVSSNRGGVVALFDNPHHSAWMREVAHLTPSTAWPCGWRALFTPNAALLGTYSSIFSRLRPLSGRCVSVNVRAGDSFLAGREGFAALTPQHEAVFACAAKASAAMGAAAGSDSGGVVPWYLTSDSPDLRRLALERWGAVQVITDPDARYVHGDCKHHGHPCTPELQNASIIHSFGQVFAASLCKAHIFDTSSSFGRVAAFATPGAELYTFNFRGHCSLQPVEAIAAVAAGN